MTAGDNPETQSATAFSDLPLSLDVLRAIQEVGYETPSPIQAQSIPSLLEGRDLLGLAQTGTGKTAAFALPMLSMLSSDADAPQVLVLTPTRELAIQVAEAFQRYARYLPNFHVLPLYGGQDMRSQLRSLRRGVDVVVGTPGRVMDHIRRDSLVLSSLRAVVLDEADEMLRMGFVDDIEWIMDRTPEQRQVALFSATMPRQIRKIADTYLKDSVTVEIKTRTATVETIMQKVCIVSGFNKLDAMTRILEVEPFDAMIIFVRTRTQTVELAEKLEARGFAASALNGDMTQALREKVVNRLKRGSLDILVATDVAARGLDVERISHVVNFDIPYDTEAYVHRIGRTGRAGRDGVAILFATHREKRMLRTIEQATGQRIDTMRLPSMRDVRDQRIRAFKEDVVGVIDKNEGLDDFREIVADLVTERAVDLEDVSAALCYLAQKDRPFPDGIEPERDEKSDPRGKRRERKSNAPQPGMVRYRVDVGREHGLTPGDLVGAIANEGKIAGSSIGHIRLFDQFTSVYLPNDMGQAALSAVTKARVRNRPLNLTPWSDGRPHHEGRPGKQRRQDRPSKKKKRTAPRNAKGRHGSSAR